MLPLLPGVTGTPASASARFTGTIANRTGSQLNSARTASVVNNLNNTETPLLLNQPPPPVYKSSSSDNDEHMFDKPFQMNPNQLQYAAANRNYAETYASGYSMDILSNGFKIRGTNNVVNGSYTYIYLAMAHNPFKYATAR